MKEDILVSIVVPIYNVEKYIHQCIESVLTQTYRKLEVILVDDGSTDNSGKICDEYASKDCRIRVVHKKNGGISSAREAGISLITGQYAMLIDGDDWIDQDTIQKCITQVFLNPKVGCVMFAYAKETKSATIPMHIMDGSVHLKGEEVKNKVYRRLFGLSQDELTHPERMENVVSCCMKLYRKDLILDGKYFDTEKVGSCEDGLFNMYALYQCEELIYIDEPLYHYRKMGGSITSTYRPRFVQQWGELFSIMENVITEKGLDDSYCKALDTRIALSITAVGLNELSNDKNNIFQHIGQIHRYICKQEYHRVASSLDITRMPIPWKLLMISSKYKMSAVVYCAIWAVQMMRKGDR